MVPCYHCISIIAHISFIIPLYFTILKRTNYRTGQSPFCNLKILLVYILLLILHPVAFFVFSLLQLVLRPSPRRGAPKTGWPSTVGRANARVRVADRLVGCAREKRGREKERDQLDLPQNRGEIRTCANTNGYRRASNGGGDASSPLALDEISLHPVRDIFHGHRLQLLSQRFSAYTFKWISNDSERYLIFSPPLILWLQKYAGDCLLKKKKKRTILCLYEKLCKMKDRKSVV